MTANENGDTTEEAEKRSRVRLKPKLPLPDSKTPFEKHFEILRGYVVGSKEGKVAVSYRDFKGLVTVSPERVSGNNKFFAHVGLIQEAGKTRRKYCPTQKTVELCNALKWNEQEAKKILAEIMSSSWFWNSANVLLQVRERATKEELVSKLGYDSGADPRKHLSSLNVLLDYLTYAGLIREQNGSFTLGTQPTVVESKEMEIKEASQEVASKTAMEPRLDVLRPHLLLGVLITPRMSEEDIRRAIRIILDELKKYSQEGE